MVGLRVVCTGWMFLAWLCGACERQVYYSEPPGPLGPNGCPLNLPSTPLPSPPPSTITGFRPGTQPGIPHPTATEVAATIADGYRNRSLSSVKLVDDRRDSQHWARQFDGVDVVGTGVVTVWLGDRWQTNRSRELHEPAPVRRDALISEARARSIVGVAASSGKVETRMVFVSIFKQLSKVPHPTNAMDVENVIDCFRLSFEVVSGRDRDLTYVDAYRGDVVQRIPHSAFVH